MNFFNLEFTDLALLHFYYLETLKYADFSNLVSLSKKRHEEVYGKYHLYS